MRILVVDDWLDTISTLELLLQSWGHDTRFSLDGPTALLIAESFHPDVVILDIGLPGTDSYEVAKQLRQNDLQKPFIIAHSGYCTEEDKKRALDAGCSFHLPKPVDPEEIRRTLGICERWLRRNPSG